jgi:hypothetical protein
MPMIHDHVMLLIWRMVQVHKHHNSCATWARNPGTMRVIQAFIKLLRGRMTARK